MLRDAGFSCVTHTNFTFGTVAVHSGFKLWDIGCGLPYPSWVLVLDFNIPSRSIAPPQANKQNQRVLQIDTSGNDFWHCDTSNSFSLGFCLIIQMPQIVKLFNLSIDLTHTVQLNNIEVRHRWAKKAFSVIKCNGKELWERGRCRKKEPGPENKVLIGKRE